MPIALTTSVAVGDLDSSAYQQVKIAKLTIDPVAKYIQLDCEYGNTNASVWEPGIHAGAAAKKQVTIQNIEGGTQHYDVLIASTSAAADEVYYDKVAAKLYQWLIDNGHFAGTVV